MMNHHKQCRAAVIWRSARTAWTWILLFGASFALCSAAANAQGPRVEFAELQIELREDQSDASVGIRLVHCPTRTPEGTVTVRVVTETSGLEAVAAKEGIDFFAFGNVQLGSVVSDSRRPSSAPRVFRLVDFPVEVVHDSDKEPIEQFSLRLELVDSTLRCSDTIVPITLGPATKISIVDVPRDQSLVSFHLAELNVTEGDGKTPKYVRFEVSRSGGNMPVSVICQTTRNGSASENDDFVPVAEVLGWGEGDSGTRHCSVPVLPDDVAERRETITLTLVPVAGELKLGTKNATIFINDDDSPGRFQFTTAEFQDYESAGRTSIAVERKGGSEGAYEVRVSAKARGATAGADYRFAETTIRWENGEEGPRAVPVELLDDDEVESEEAVFFSLVGNSDGSESTETPLGDFRSAVLRILDDDGAHKPPPVAVPAVEPAAPLVPRPEPAAPHVQPAKPAPTPAVSSPASEQKRPMVSAKLESGDEVTVGTPQLLWSPTGLEVRLDLRNRRETTKEVTLELVIKNNLEVVSRIEGQIMLQPSALHHFKHLFTGLPKGNYTVAHFVRD